MPELFSENNFRFSPAWHGHCCNDPCADNYEPDCDSGIPDGYGENKIAGIETCLYGSIYGQQGKDAAPPCTPVYPTPTAKTPTPTPATHTPSIPTPTPTNTRSDTPTSITPTPTPTTTTTNNCVNASVCGDSSSGFNKTCVKNSSNIALGTYYSTISGSGEPVCLIISEATNCNCTEDLYLIGGGYIDSDTSCNSCPTPTPTPTLDCVDIYPCGQAGSFGPYKRGSGISNGVYSSGQGCVRVSSSNSNSCSDGNFSSFIFLGSDCDSCFTPTHTQTFKKKENEK